MYTRNLLLKIILLILSLISTVAFCTYFLYTAKYLYSLVLILPVSFEILYLVYLYRSTNRKITYFFDSVGNGDISSTFPENVKDKTLRELHKSLNRVNRIFAMTRTETETKEQFYRSLIRHAKTGLMAVNPEGRILEINPSLENMFGSYTLSVLNDFNKIDPRIPDLVNTLEPGMPAILKVRVDTELQQLLFNKAIFQTKNGEVSILSIDNIKNELDQKELESWIRLIRVLNHEIVNAVTPISTLSTTIHGLFHKEGKLYVSGISKEVLSDTADALRNIDTHAKGLMEFVDSYRKFTRIPEPDFQEILLEDFIRDEIISLKGNFEEEHVEINTTADPEGVTILADPGLLQRLFSNLLINAIQSMEKCSKKRIDISTSITYHNRTIVKIADSGEGIPEDQLDQVFVPFFSTKENGSGIGLSLSRQIMQLHKGEISISSRIGEGTEVSLIF
jgi:two-component system, NtrC family, nitrogen regulation sensor histidine kinase NtrY